MVNKPNRDIILDNDSILIPKGVKSGAVQESVPLGFNCIQ